MRVLRHGVRHLGAVAALAGQPQVAGRSPHVAQVLRSRLLQFTILASALSRLNPTHVEVVDCFLHAAQSRRRLAILAKAELLPRRIEKFCRLTARPRAKYPFAPRSCPQEGQASPADRIPGRPLSPSGLHHFAVRVVPSAVL